MSRRQVDSAIECAQRADWEGVDRCLENVELGFIRRRLIARFQTVPPARHAILALWNRQFPGESTSALTDVKGLPSEAESEPREPERPWRKVVAPSLVTLEEPQEFLRLLVGDDNLEISFADTKVVHMWALAALAAMAHRDERSVMVDFGHSKAGGFAIAQGLAHHVKGEAYTPGAEKDRSLNLTAISRFDEIDAASTRIAELVVRDPEHVETRRAIFYVLMELIRNAVQHSLDPRGGMVAAQLMTEKNRYESPRVQVVVADQGVGIFESMRGLHPGLTTPAQAVMKSLLPFISGTFSEGEQSTLQNAGMGLFVISEIAKLTAGTMLVATRGTTLVIKGDPEFEGNHHVDILKPEGLGFNGTLVAFELPLDSVWDFQNLFALITEKAKSMHPSTSNRWITFDDASTADAGKTLLVRLFAENTSVANEYARTKLTKFVAEGVPVILDFQGIDLCTQSFVHALLFAPLRDAWKLRIPITAKNASPVVRSALEMLESYTLVDR